MKFFRAIIQIKLRKFSNLKTAHPQEKAGKGTKDLRVSGRANPTNSCRFGCPVDLYGDVGYNANMICIRRRHCHVQGIELISLSFVRYEAFFEARGKWGARRARASNEWQTTVTARRPPSMIGSAHEAASPFSIARRCANDNDTLPYSCLERGPGWCGVGLQAPYKPTAPTICNLLFLHCPPSTNTVSNRPVDPGILPIVEGFESRLSWHVDGREFCFSNSLASGAFWRWWWSESC